MSRPLSHWLAELRVAAQIETAGDFRSCIRAGVDIARCYTARATFEAEVKLFGQDDTQPDREVEDRENCFAVRDQRH
jgi:hypothetical protein